MEASDLLKFKNWVVVGDVLNKEKYAYKILKELKDNGFNAVGVNMKASENGVYKSLSEVPYNIEVLDLCINPVKGIEAINEANILKIKRILVQPGAESSEILNYCKNSGIISIEGCALVELSKFRE